MNANQADTACGKPKRLALWLRLLPYGLNLIYFGLLLLILPVVLYRMIAHGRYRQGLRQKLFGLVPRLPSAVPGSESCHERFWFHAVSVGEVLLLETVLQKLGEAAPDAEIVISTSTDTGYELARSRYPDLVVFFFPLDFTWAVRNAIRRIQPTRIVLAELELWPGFIVAAAGANTPLTLINGRLSERSFRGYSRIGFVMKRLLRSFDCLGVQSRTYSERFQLLGASADQISVTGSVKFDRIESDRENPATERLRKLFRLRRDEPVFVAGSTIDPEEWIALQSWLAVRERFPQLRLVLVPRHQERFDDVASLVESLSLPVWRRSQRTEDLSEESGLVEAESPNTPPVLLLDTLGELSACWGLADFAFVGGSLGRRGGQNMIEPSGYGAAVCFGPDTRNFRDVVQPLLEENAATVVRNRSELTSTLMAWLDNPIVAKAQGKRAQEFVTTQPGASDRTVQLLTGRRAEPSPVAPQGDAKPEMPTNYAA